MNVVVCSALHGDIAQSAREATLAGFRSGRFNVLVATDVAARGLDINGIELVIQVGAGASSGDHVACSCCTSFARSSCMLPGSLDDSSLSGLCQQTVFCHNSTHPDMFTPLCTVILNAG